MSGIVQAADTATKRLSDNASGAIPVGYGYYPGEGSRAVAAQYNWTTISGYAEDVSQLQAKGMESTIQSVYIDNGSNAANVTITVAQSGQVITCPANSQGVFPLFIAEMGGFTIVSTVSATVTRCLFLNFPVSPAVWHV